MFSDSVKFLFLAVFVTAACGSDFGEEFMLEKIKEWLNNTEKQPGKITPCSIQFNKWMEILTTTKFMTDNWAWRMFDAINKMNPGILTGNLVGTGNLDECLAIDDIQDNVAIKGKYCFGAIPIELGESNMEETSAVSNRYAINRPIAYVMSICIPHECLLTDFLPAMPEEESFQLDSLCQTADTFSEWNVGDYAFIAFLAIIAVLVLFSTCYDWYIRHKEQKPIHPIALAFSFYTNGEKLLKVTNNPDQMQCLNGLRTMSMFWILAGHRFQVSTSVPIENVDYANEWTTHIYSQYIQFAQIAVDTFFFITGVLTAYGFLQSQSKPNARFNIPMFYLHRYLRLTPAVGVLYFFYVTLFRHVTSGPIFPLFATLEGQNCLDHWYSYFLYIQNYVNPEHECLGHTWYLSVDMQIFIVSPLILIPLLKLSKSMGYGLILILIAFSVLPPILIIYFYDILELDVNFMKRYYVQPYTRFGPWAVGVLLGYIFYQFRDRKIKINWITNLAIWALVLTGMTAIFCVGNEASRTTDVLTYAFYNGFHRTFWAFGLMWIVFACQKGYGGIINWFLTLPLFQVMARLSFSMYLVHMVIQILSIFRKRSPLHFDDYEMLNQCFGDIITVTFIAFFFTLMFESPMVVVEKILFSSASANPKVENSYDIAKQPKAVVPNGVALNV